MLETSENLRRGVESLPRGAPNFCLSLVAMLAAGALSAPAFALDDARWLLQTSVYTRHYHYSPEHNNNQHLINLEYQRADHWVFGGSEFDNSFNQPSQYFYVGKRYQPLESLPSMHFKITGGLIHGYKDRYQDKIPLNALGVAPAIVPAVGVSGKLLSSEVSFLGTAGLMLTLGVHY